MKWLVVSVDMCRFSANRLYGLMSCWFLFNGRRGIGVSYQLQFLW